MERTRDNVTGVANIVCLCACETEATQIDAGEFIEGRQVPQELLQVHCARAQVMLWETYNDMSKEAECYTFTFFQSYIHERETESNKDNISGELTHTRGVE